MTGTGEGDPPLSIGSEAKIYFIQILSIVYWQAIEMREREAGDRYLQWRRNRYDEYVLTPTTRQPQSFTNPTESESKNDHR